MKKVTFLTFFTPFICLIMNFSVVAYAQRTSGSAVQGESDPYEVTLYRQKDYVDPIGTWKLAPGMRMLKVPKVDIKPSSIFLGSNVAVVIFPDYDFSSKLTIANKYSVQFGSVNEPVSWWLYIYERFKGSSPEIKFPDSRLLSPFTRCSLIVHRKDINDFLGVYLESGTDTTKGNWGQFYPLPDKARESAIIYNKIPFGGPFKLHFMAGGLGGMSLYPSTTPPNPDNMAVTITRSNGSTLKFPEPNARTGTYQLDQYSQISSIMIQYKGPFDQSAYIVPTSVRVVAPTAPDSPPPAATGTQGAQGTLGGPKKVVAPKAPDSLPPAAIGTQGAQGTLGGPKKKVASTTEVAPVTIPNVSGQWKSSIGLTYNITQQQDRFQWTVANSNEKGEGTITGNDLSASWKGQQGAGSSAGKITAVDSTGMATQIEWKNGVRFYR